MPKVLIVGNGFDLFHSLPTKYIHFITIIKTIDKLKSYDNDLSFEELFSSDFKGIDNEFYEEIKKTYNTECITFSKENILSIKNILSENRLWFNFFNKISNINTWIDLEKEIEYLLVGVDKFINHIKVKFNKNNENFHEFVHIRDDDFYNGRKFIYNSMEDFNIIGKKNKNYINNELFEKYIDNRYNGINVELVLDDLYIYFENFIKLFNKYLVNIVSEFYGKEKNKFNYPFSLIDEFYSFNYIPTLEKIYNVDSKKLRYIHGKIDEVDELQTLILGINSIYKKFNNINNHSFTKYYQKIIKNNDSFITIVDERQSDENYLFFVFGHSLNESDKIYLEDILNSIKEYKEKSTVTIFYYNQEDKKRKLNNLFNIAKKHEEINLLYKQQKIIFIEISESNIKNAFEQNLVKREAIFFT